MADGKWSMAGWLHHRPLTICHQPSAISHQPLFGAQRFERNDSGQLPTLNGTDAIWLPHEMAIAPPSSVMSTNPHVSCSTVCGSVSSFIGARTTSLSRV